MNHFIPYCEDLDTVQLTNVFKKEILTVHRLLHNIITSRGNVFTSALGEQTRIKLVDEWSLRLAFHPQTG